MHSIFFRFLLHKNPKSSNQYLASKNSFWICKTLRYAMWNNCRPFWKFQINDQINLFEYTSINSVHRVSHHIAQYFEMRWWQFHQYLLKVIAWRNGGWKFHKDLKIPHEFILLYGSFRLLVNNLAHLVAWYAAWCAWSLSAQPGAPG